MRRRGRSDLGGAAAGSASGNNSCGRDDRPCVGQRRWLRLAAVTRSAVTGHSWRRTRARGTNGQLLWWSSASSYTLMTADLGDFAQWRLGVRCTEMDSCRRRTLSGIMVASMAERPGKVDALGSSLKMD